MIGALAFAFVAGAVATANPCGFALLPAYLARRLGTDDSDGGNRLDAAVRASAVGAATTAGFLLIFGVAGGVIALGGRWLVLGVPWAGFAIGIVLTAMGLAVMAGRRMGVRLPVMGRVAGESGLGGDLAFGIGYGTVSLSCMLPVLLAVTGTALTGGLLASAFSFAAFALGMATVFMSLAVAAAFARRGLAVAVGRLGAYVNRASGALLFLAGAYVTYYWGVSLFSSGSPRETGLLAYGERLSGAARGWLGGSAGWPVILGLLVSLAVLLAWALWRRAASSSRRAGRASRPAEAREPDSVARG